MTTKPLANPRHERFAQLLASGETADSAYQNAGFKPHRGNASRLSSNEIVRARVAAILAKAAAQVVIDRSWVIGKLVNSVTYGQAVERDGGKITPGATFNLAAANRALELVGRDMGMFQPAEPTATVGASHSIPHEIADRGHYDLARRLAYILQRKALPPAR